MKSSNSVTSTNGPSFSFSQYLSPISKFLVNLKPTLFKVWLLHGCFPSCLNCTNSTKSRKASHIDLKMKGKKKKTEAVDRRHSWKYQFWKVPLPEYLSGKVTGSRPAIILKRDYGIGVFLQILQKKKNWADFYKAAVNGVSWIGRSFVFYFV